MAKLNEDVKVVMLKGEKGERGEAGTGIPTGGKTGQAIIKASDNDYDYKWGSLVVNDVANATNDGNGNNIVNTYATKAELNTAKTDASDTYLTKTDASDTYLTKTDATSTYLSKTDATVESHKDAIKNAFIDTTNNLPLIVRTVSTANVYKDLNTGEIITGMNVGRDNCADIGKYKNLGYELIECAGIFFWTGKNAEGFVATNVIAGQPFVDSNRVQIYGKNTGTAVTIQSVTMSLVFAHRRLVDQSHATLW